nr:hypothetical protein [Tanacetum cinerariifolium]
NCSHASCNSWTTSVIIEGLYRMYEIQSCSCPEVNSTGASYVSSLCHSSCPLRSTIIFNSLLRRNVKYHEPEYLKFGEEGTSIFGTQLDKSMLSLVILLHTSPLTKDVGAEADFSNLETNITVSPILTSSVYNYHLVTQIISDLSLAPQTKSMTRMVKDQGGLS